MGHPISHGQISSTSRWISNAQMVSTETATTILSAVFSSKLKRKIELISNEINTFDIK